MGVFLTHPGKVNSVVIAMEISGGQRGCLINCHALFIGEKCRYPRRKHPAGDGEKRGAEYRSLVGKIGGVNPISLCYL